MICFLASVVSSCERTKVTTETPGAKVSDEETRTTEKPKAPNSKPEVLEPELDKETPVTDGTTAEAPKDSTLEREDITKEPGTETVTTPKKIAPVEKAEVTVKPEVNPESITQEPDKGTPKAEQTPPSKGAAEPAKKSPFTFTLDDLKASGLFKESDIYSPFYVHMLLSQPYALLNNKEMRSNIEFVKFLRSLCFDNGGCKKGVDLKKLNRSRIAHFINYIGIFLPSAVIVDKHSSTTPTTDAPLTIYFQPGAWIEDTELTESHISSIRQKEASRMLINFSQPHFNINNYFIMGEYIKQSGMDLHIIGKCSDYCASYLLTAAKTIYIESYGFISYSVTPRGLKKDIERIMPKQQEKVQQFINSSKVDDFLVDIFMDRREKINNKVKSGEAIDDVDSNFMNSLKNWDDDGKKKGIKIADKLQKFLYDKGPISILEMSNTEVMEFLESLSSDLLKTIRQFLFETSNLQRYSIALSIVNGSFRQELRYFKKLQIIDNLNSNESDSYTDFLDLVSFLVKSEWYDRYFNVPRAYYNIPEKDKPWDKVAPSADLLRSLGLNIQGENNMDIFEITGNIEEVLYLDNGRIENCDFFAKNASYTTETLKQCLNLP